MLLQLCRTVILGKYMMNGRVRDRINKNKQDKLLLTKIVRLHVSKEPAHAIRNVSACAWQRKVRRGVAEEVLFISVAINKHRGRVNNPPSQKLLCTGDCRS